MLPHCNTRYVIKILSLLFRGMKNTFMCSKILVWKYLFVCTIYIWKFQRIVDEHQIHSFFLFSIFKKKNSHGIRIKIICFEFILIIENIVLRSIQEENNSIQMIKWTNQQMSKILTAFIWVKNKLICRYYRYIFFSDFRVEFEYFHIHSFFSCKCKTLKWTRSYWTYEFNLIFGILIFENFHVIDSNQRLTCDFDLKRHRSFSRMDSS